MALPQGGCAWSREVYDCEIRFDTMTLDGNDVSVKDCFAGTDINPCLSQLERYLIVKGSVCSLNFKS